MNPVIINLWYVVAAALFIFGLKQLGSPATAVRGNVSVLAGHGDRHRRDSVQQGHPDI
jgi:NAD/NADP transhydrogenase beta subunit